MISAHNASTASAQNYQMTVQSPSKDPNAVHANSSGPDYQGPVLSLSKDLNALRANHSGPDYQGPVLSLSKDLNALRALGVLHRSWTWWLWRLEHVSMHYVLWGSCTGGRFFGHVSCCFYWGIFGRFRQDVKYNSCGMYTSVFAHTKPLFLYVLANCFSVSLYFSCT